MAKKKPGGLGRGLDSLFGGDVVTAEIMKEEKPDKPEETDGTISTRQIPLLSIDPNPRQPRKHFEPERLEELARSIQVHGILQPLVLTPRDGRYMLVAGERRWRAARQVGLESVPAVVLDLDDRQAAEISLVENLQRSDLNPMEEAEGIAQLMEQFDMTQDQAAQRLGRSRPALANSLRLLALGEVLQQYVREGRLSAGHARTLLGLKEEKQRIQLADRAMAEGWSVRQLEEAVRALKETAEAAPRPRHTKVSIPELNDWTDRLMETFGTKVSVQGDLDKGVLMLHYYRREDLERIHELLNRLQ